MSTHTNSTRKTTFLYEKKINVNKTILDDIMVYSKPKKLLLKLLLQSFLAHLDNLMKFMEVWKRGIELSKKSL